MWVVARVVPLLLFYVAGGCCNGGLHGHGTLEALSVGFGAVIWGMKVMAPVARFRFKGAMLRFPKVGFGRVVTCVRAALQLKSCRHRGHGSLKLDFGSLQCCSLSLNRVAGVVTFMPWVAALKPMDGASGVSWLCGPLLWWPFATWSSGRGMARVVTYMRAALQL